MFSKIYSASLLGIDAISIDVEIDAKKGLPAEFIVGLPDTVVRESKTRIRAALKNSGFDYPHKQYTINLAPADIPKEGAYFDLAIAIGILSVNGHVDINHDATIVGELSLDGSLKPVKGILSICELVSKRDCKKLILPKENLEEAAMISSIELFPVAHLQELTFLDLDKPKTYKSKFSSDKRSFPVDFAEVKGQLLAKKALQIAAAGYHNCLFIGPPGSGKSMLLKRLPSILSPLTENEAIETHKILSISSLSTSNKTISRIRPFRQPHHTISYAGLVGGGTKPSPGEISLAHNGVLFLDELPEFSRQVLEVLRQPLENGNIIISRANQSLEFPCKFIFVAAMNPCPCGYYGDSSKQCQCTDSAIQRYLKKVSGPILDRFDIILEIPRLKKTDFNDAIAGSNSDQLFSEVSRCIDKQQKRYGKAIQNGQLSPKDLQKHINLNAEQKTFLGNCVEKGLLTGRSYDKVLKIARTLADLENNEKIEDYHLSEALQYRQYKL